MLKELQHESVPFSNKALLLCTKTGRLCICKLFVKKGTEQIFVIVLRFVCIFIFNKNVHCAEKQMLLLPWLGSHRDPIAN